jgi:type I restriction enzyme M protein
MLTDPKLRSQVDQLWDKLWTGGLSNPMDAIEQLCYLLFLKRLDESEAQREKQARRVGQVFEPRVPAEMRWSEWTQYPAPEALKHVRDKVFVWLRDWGDENSSFARYMQTAEFKINKPNLLIEACRAIDQLQISAQNQDVQGDLFEYLLSRLSIAGRNGQFRTPRHIIRMMVRMTDPQPDEHIGDLAAGTGGFIVNAYQHILEKNTSPDLLTRDAEGQAHNLVGDLLTDQQRAFLQNGAFRAYDNDSGMTMLRIGSMNLMLHGLESPRFFYMDTLSKAFAETRDYDLILMNPPFKGAVDKADVSATLPGDTTKSELLFLHLILRALEMGGRCAVVVPDGVLFGSSRAHVATRKKLIEDNRLDGVISMPGGVFKPYAGVSTAVLFFTRGAQTERIWYYDMAHDGFSLDDKRLPVPDNDIPNILDCWANRSYVQFQARQGARLAELRGQAEPLMAERMKMHAEISRLTFEAAIAPDDDENPRAALDADQAQLSGLESELAPLQKEIDQLSRQFWVTKEQVAANKYDLSASRYRQVDTGETFHELPTLTLERMLALEEVTRKEIVHLKNMSI